MLLLRSLYLSTLYLWWMVPLIEHILMKYLVYKRFVSALGHVTLPNEALLRVQFGNSAG